MTPTEERPTPTDGDGDEQATVTVHQCSEDRVVFVEKQNADAWIATDTAVDLSN